MATKPIQTLIDKMPRKDVLKAKKQALKILKELELKEIRQTKKISQEKLAKALNTKQTNISRLEGRKDMHISTLKNYIEALGGELEVIAKFPQGKIRINHFRNISKS